MAPKLEHWIVIEKDPRDEEPAWRVFRRGQGKRSKDTLKAARKALRLSQGLGREALGFLMERSVPAAEILEHRGRHPEATVLMS